MGGSSLYTQTSNAKICVPSTHSASFCFCQWNRKILSLCAFLTRSNDTQVPRGEVSSFSCDAMFSALFRLLLRGSYMNRLCVRVNVIGESTAHKSSYLLKQVRWCHCNHFPCQSRTGQICVTRTQQSLFDISKPLWSPTPLYGSFSNTFGPSLAKNK